MVGQSLEINCGDWPHQEQGMLTMLAEITWGGWPHHYQSANCEGADLITGNEEGSENIEIGGSVPGNHLGGLAPPLSKCQL